MKVETMADKGKEVGFFGGGQVSVADGADIAARINESAANDPRGGAGDSLYLNFSGKKGIYTIGPDARKIGEEEMWAVNIASFEDGWMCWKGGRPAAQRMANIFTGVPVSRPDDEEFGPFDSTRGEGWFQAKALTLRSCDNGEQGYFKINSKSGVSAMAGLQREVAERSVAGMSRWPIVQLQAETFESQGYKNEKPVFNVVGWITDEQVVALGEGGDVNELLDEAEKPAKAEKEEAAPRRRARSL